MDLQAELGAETAQFQIGTLPAFLKEPVSCDRTPFLSMSVRNRGGSALYYGAG